MAAALRVMTLGPSPQKTSPKTCVLLPSDHSPQKMSVLLPAKRASPATAPDAAAASSPAAVAAAADMLRCKRRITFSGSVHTHVHHHQPASVARRNARERNRVKQVNNGFATLRQHIPMSLILAAAAERASSPSERQPSGRCGNSGSAAAAAAKKMSKVETLRCAVEYIRSLQSLLDSENSPSEVPVPQGPGGGLLDGPFCGATSSEGSPVYQFPTQAPPPSSLSSPPPSSSSASPSASPSLSYASDEASSAYTPSCGAFYDSHSAATPADAYKPMTPEDEELLDVISWWQQSQ